MPIAVRPAVVPLSPELRGSRSLELEHLPAAAAFASPGSDIKNPPPPPSFSTSACPDNGDGERLPVKREARYHGPEPDDLVPEPNRLSELSCRSPLAPPQLRAPGDGLGGGKGGKGGIGGSEDSTARLRLGLIGYRRRRPSSRRRPSPRLRTLAAEFHRDPSKGLCMHHRSLETRLAASRQVTSHQP